MQRIMKIRTVFNELLSTQSTWVLDNDTIMWVADSIPRLTKFLLEELHSIASGTQYYTQHSVESEQMHITYISTAVLFVTGLTTRLSSTNRNSFVYIGS